MPGGPQQVTLFQFDSFALDTEKGELRRGNERVSIQEKPLQLLALLVAKPGQLVTRDAIRQALWGVDTFVEFDDNLNHLVKKLREALGDSAESPRFIKTLPRQGYRFLAEVRTGSPSPSGTMRSRRWIGVGALLLLALGLLTAFLMRQESPPASLLVMPFEALDATARHGRIGEGISEQVTAKLMGLKGLRLISPEAAYRVHAAGTTPKAAGQRLNAEAVLIGSVRTANGKIRVNAQLIRTSDGRILWADGGLEIEARDLLEAERVLATGIALRLRGRLTAEERTEMVSTSTSNAEAHELFVRGKMARYERPRQRGLAVAEQLFEQAVRLDPRFAEALAWLAMIQFQRFFEGTAGEAVRQAGEENARKALTIDPSMAVARSALIGIFYTTGRAEDGLKEVAVLRQNSSVDASALSAIAGAYERAGMPDRAVPFFQRALEMDPEDTQTREQLAFMAYWAGQYDFGMRLLEGQPPHVAPLPRMSLAFSTGRRELARSAALELLQNPDRDRHTVFGAKCLRDLGEGEVVQRVLPERLRVMEGKSEILRNERALIALGLGYSLLGDKQAAREKVRRALELNPDNPWTLFFSAEIYAEGGDERQAIDYLRQAISRGFLSRHFMDWPHNRLYKLRAQPEIRALRDELTAKIDRFRKQY